MRFSKFCKKHSVLNEILDMARYDIPIKRMFPYYCALPGLVFETDNIDSFYRKLRFFKDRRAEELINDSNGKNGNYKLTERHIREIKRIYSSPRQLSGREIHEKLNDWCVINGHTKISISSIKRILADPFIQNLCNRKRYGEEWYRTNIEPFNLREEPKENGELWQIDGSRLQFPYLTSFNKIGFLNLFVVMDVHSRKIVGYSLAPSENHVLVIDSIKSAVEKTGYVPNTMVFDNGSAFKHEKFRTLSNQLSHFGTRMIRHAPGKPNQKGHVERFFSTFQTTVCKHYDGYLGEGITSKRVNARPSQEILKENFKKSNLRSRSQLEGLAKKQIKEYNKLKLNKSKLSPSLKFKSAKKNKYAFPIGSNDFALLFWDRIKDYKIKNSMVILSKGSHREIQYQYIIDGRMEKYSLNGKALNVLFHKTDRSIIKLFDQNEKFIMDVSKTKKVNTVQRRKVINPESNDSRRVKPSINSIAKLNRSKDVFNVPASLDKFLIKSKHYE